MTRLVSAEEARGLLEGAVPAGSVSSMQRLYAAAPGLAATVIALSEELARVNAQADDIDQALRSEQVAIAAIATERDRLRAILACERGETAPEGWAWTTYAIGDGNTHSEWQRRVPGIVLALSVWCGKIGTWHWQVHPPGGSQQGSAPTALEAIEAADRAATPQ